MNDTEIRCTAPDAWAAKNSTVGVSSRLMHDKNLSNTKKLQKQCVINVNYYFFTSVLPLNCSENCILYLRNRHVVILSSLKLWEKGTVSIFVFTKFPFSTYFLRHFDLKTTLYPVTICHYRSFARRQVYSTSPNESWFNEKRKAFLWVYSQSFPLLLGWLMAGRQTSVAAPLPHGSV